MMTGFRLNLSPLKEPLGFVKLVEWACVSVEYLDQHLNGNCTDDQVPHIINQRISVRLTAVFAFGTCGGYSGRNVVSVFCGDRNETLNADFFYPFRLSHVPLVEGNATLCNHSVSTTHMVGDSSSSVQFFVGIGIVCFLYCMAAMLVYLGFMHVYKNSDFGPIFDFLITSILVFLWLVCSSAWAKGLQNVKNATDTDGISGTLALCRGTNITCEVTDYANMRTLNISVVFGYLNMFVWAGNAWFVYKETRWHSQKTSSPPGLSRQQVPAPI